MPSQEPSPPGRADDRHDDSNRAGADALTADALSARAASFAGRAVDYGPFRPVPELIEEQADRHPARTAVCYAGRTLSYRQLDQLANGLAMTVTARGVGTGDRVAVLLVNSLEMPVAYLALMKLGAVFVPLDPAWPADRLRATLAVLAPRLILRAAPGVSGGGTGPRGTGPGSVRPADVGPGAPGVPGQLGHDPVPEEFRRDAVVVDTARITPSARRPAVPLRPEDLIYGFFTSGTTGVPKCAMNRHAGLANRLNFMTRYFAATGDEVVLQNSKHTFDSSLWQLCWPLITGGRTVLPVQGEFLDLERTIDTIARYAITATDFVSSIFNVLVAIVDGDERAQRKLESLRYLIVGSEEINPRAVHRFRSLLPRVQVTNGYGPTETAIGMVFHPVSDADGDKIPLGRPIDNCYVAVVDQAGHPVPRGAVGEIAIGGTCTGDGYHGDPAATARAFVSNRFPGQIPGDRLYLSGDLGYLDDDGQLYFSGRKDFQVKIGGVRIELGEIELAAQQSPAVRQAKALVAERAGAKSLALFVSGGDGLTEAGLRDHLRAILPRTSMPRHCFVLPRMPLSDGGKVDWRALRARLSATLDVAPDADVATLARQNAPAGAASPADLTGQVARVLRNVLGQGALDADADFIDAGGDSIQALLAARRLTAKCGIEVAVQDLFDHPTARRLTALIETRRADGEPASGQSAEAVTIAAAATTAGPAPAVTTAGPAEAAEIALMERDCAARPLEPIRAADPAGELRTVLVTGATGFVGSRLVHELLVSTDLRLLCLARAADDDLAIRRVAAALAERGLWQPRFASRIEGYAADLGQPDLGLAAGTWEHLARTCDLVLHNGALVNFLHGYRAHRPANVTGTAALLRLAMTHRPVPMHHISTLAALQHEAVRQPGRLPEHYQPGSAQAPAGGYSRSKWVAERYLAQARSLGAVITVLRLGEVMPSEDNASPNPLALTHLLLSAIHRLGVRPDVTIRSDYTPVDYVAARVGAAVRDRRAWGRTLHVFHPQSVCFAEALGRAGAPVTRTSCGDFLARLRAAAQVPGERDLARLAALLPPSSQNEAELRQWMRALLTDNPALFSKDECRALERRWRLADGELTGPISAYRAYLGRPAAGRMPAPPRPGQQPAALADDPRRPTGRS